MPVLTGPEHRNAAVRPGSACQKSLITVYGGGGFPDSDPETTRCAVRHVAPSHSATAIGANSQAAQSILKTEYVEGMSILDARKLAIKVLNPEP